jgi:hypothetical protein
VAVGSLWMVGITLLLFFLPLVNGLLGGLVGGYKVGTPGRALAAAILPGVVVAVGLWLLLALLDLPFLGFFAGLAAGLAVLLSEVGLLVGAIGGGWLARQRERRPVEVRV